MRVISIALLIVAIAVSAFANNNLRPGAAAPDFSGESLEGKTFNLSELRGKVVVVTFWSTKCGICHSEIPKLNRVAERYRDKDVVFLALTMENQVKVEPYLRKTPFSFNILPNSFGVLLKYADREPNGNINIGFPAHFIVDRNGAIAVRTAGWDKASNIDAHISRLLTSN